MAAIKMVFEMILYLIKSLVATLLGFDDEDDNDPGEFFDSLNRMKRRDH